MSARKQTLAPTSCPAAADNLTPEFFRILTVLGLELVAVRLVASGSGFNVPTAVADELGNELAKIGAGQLDSSAYAPGEWWIFFHASDLAKAIETLKTSLAARGLLKISTILHAESAQNFCVWYPPTAAAIELVNDVSEEA